MPALLKIKRSIENDIWKLSFSLDVLSLSENDKELIRKFGEPQINIGGTYLEGSDDEYILADKYIRVRSDLPYVQEFDSKSIIISEGTQGAQSPEASAEARALDFQEHFVELYATSFAELRAKADTFTGEYIENI